MLKARSTVTTEADGIDFVKEFIQMQLENIDDVASIRFFRDRVSPDGKGRTDLTIEIKPSETGRFRRGIKKAIQNALVDVDTTVYF